MCYGCECLARRADLSRRTITYLRRSREMCYGCECFARRAHLRIVRRTLCSREWSGSSRIEDAGLVADVSMQDSQSKGGRKCLILASYDHVSSTIERNVLWVRMSRTTGGSLASYDHVSLTMERNVLRVRMSRTTGPSLASYDHVSSTIERNVLWVRMSRTTGAISRVVRSRIFDDREKCVIVRVPVEYVCDDRRRNGGK